jgi:restriction endonuclease S subunit
MQKSQLEGASRLDAEYYQPDYLRSQNRLMAFKTSPLSSLCKVTDGNHSSISECFIKSGVRYLRGQDLTDFFISYAAPIYIPEDVFKKLRRSHIFKEDVLVSIVGTIGLVSIVAKDFDKLTGNCKIAILHTEKIDPWYLAIFLASKYGQNQIHRKVAGAVQTGIILKDLAGISIPIFNENEQAKIRQIAINAYENQINSEALYSQAERLLLKELGLENFEINEELAYIVNLSEVKSAHRSDAEYFQPKYDELIKRIAKNEHEKLIKLANRVKTKIEPIPDRLYKYIEISDIDISDGSADFNEIIGQELPANASIPIKGLELVISKVRPTRGAISILPPDFNEDFICSGAFSVFTVSWALKEYLFVVLRSIIGKLQFEKPTTGTSYPTITDEDVEDILVPILPQPFQQEISDLVRKSHEARQKAKDLLEKAKREVEELIGEK